MCIVGCFRSGNGRDYRSSDLFGRNKRYFDDRENVWMWNIVGNVQNCNCDDKTTSYLQKWNENKCQKFSVEVCLSLQMAMCMERIAILFIQKEMPYNSPTADCFFFQKNETYLPVKYTTARVASYQISQQQAFHGASLQHRLERRIFFIIYLIFPTNAPASQAQKQKLYSSNYSKYFFYFRQKMSKYF